MSRGALTVEIFYTIVILIGYVRHRPFFLKLIFYRWILLEMEAITDTENYLYYYDVLVCRNVKIDAYACRVFTFNQHFFSPP